MRTERNLNFNRKVDLLIFPGYCDRTLILPYRDHSVTAKSLAIPFSLKDYLPPPSTVNRSALIVFFNLNLSFLTLPLPWRLEKIFFSFYVHAGKKNLIWNKIKVNGVRSKVGGGERRTLNYSESFVFGTLPLAFRYRPVLLPLPSSHVSVTVMF